ncbi:MAG: four-helix bundle copper-binding protein [Hyphomicrobiaceae bacterium]|nr:four-helix bundle copper-binding protein [Hyphomicrobiaceae bacterium]
MHILEIMKTHPHTATEDAVPVIQCIEACFDCSQTTVACADACLAEPDPAKLARCIRINGETSDIAIVTGRLLSRRLPSNASIWAKQLEACVVAARMCAEECERHAAQHDHCRVCAAACRKCESAVNALLTIYRQKGDMVA